MKNIIRAFDVRYDTMIQGGSDWNHMEANIAEPIRRLIASNYGINAKLLPVKLNPDKTSELKICYFTNEDNSAEVPAELKDCSTEKDDSVTDYVEEFVDLNNMGMCTALFEDDDKKTKMSTYISELYPQFILQQITVTNDKHKEYHYYIPMYIGNMGVAIYEIQAFNIKYPFFILSHHPRASYRLDVNISNSSLCNGLSFAKLCGITDHNKVGLSKTLGETICMMKYLLLNSGFGDPLTIDGVTDQCMKLIIYEINHDVTGVDPYPKKYCDILDSLVSLNMEATHDVTVNPRCKFKIDNYVNESDEQAMKQFKEFDNSRQRWFANIINEFMKNPPKSEDGEIYDDLCEFYGDFPSEPTSENEVKKIIDGITGGRFKPFKKKK